MVLAHTKHPFAHHAELFIRRRPICLEIIIHGSLCPVVDVHTASLYNTFRCTFHHHNVSCGLLRVCGNRQRPFIHAIEGNLQYSGVCRTELKYGDQAVTVSQQFSCLRRSLRFTLTFFAASASATFISFVGTEVVVDAAAAGSSS
jgi:hypothetical protein